MSMDGELAIGKLSETNLYFKLSPYLLLGKAPSEWFLPNNLIRNLISWLNSLSSNKCTHLNISILLALTEQFNTSTCILNTFQICATKLFGPCCLPIFGAITIPPAPRHFVTLPVYQGVENYPKCCVFLRFLVFQISALCTSLLLPGPFVRLSWA